MTDLLHGIKVPEKLKQNNLRPGEKRRSNPTNFKGYPGLAHTAKPISEYIPKCDIFVEEFAGLGRIAKHVTANKIVLNDLSAFSIKYLKKNFINAEISMLDFLQCMWHYDGPGTTHFFDPVWYEDCYTINPLTVCTMKPKQYYLKLKEVLPSISGNWYVVSDTTNRYAELIDGYSVEVRSKKPYLFGLYAKTLIVSNKPLQKYTATLESFSH